MKWGRSVIYPNLYIVLVGPSGRGKKGTALEFAMPMIRATTAKLVHGAITKEKLIRRMGGHLDSFDDPSTNQIKFHCSTTFVSDELAVFLGQHNTALLADLCDWYDSKDEWVYDTKGEGTDTLQGVCLTMLGATAPDWLPTILPQEAVGGGFTSRVIWVVEEDKGKTVVYPTIDEELEQVLINQLQEINIVAGEYRFDDEALDSYAAWYTQMDRKISQGKPPILDPKFAGYCDRRATLIKKLSMVIAASEGSFEVITKHHFERSIHLLEQTELKMPRAFSSLGESRYAAATNILMDFIIKHGKVSRSQVLRFFMGDIDEWTYNVITSTLVAMKVIKREHYPQQDEEILTLVEKDATDD